MTAPTSPSRGGPLLGALLAGLLLAAPLLAWQLARAPGAGLGLSLFDFTAFWSAARLVSQGQDPYDPDALAALQREAEPGGGDRDPLVMWPAPWALGLLLPLASLSPHAARLVWVLAQFGALLLALELGWRVYSEGGVGAPEGDAADRRWVAWLVAFTAVPTYFVLITGQFGPLLLLGAVGFVAAERAGRPYLAGACLVLLAIKPQLAFLFWLALAVWLVRGFRWRIVLGGLAAAGILLLGPLLADSSLPWQYYHSLSTRNQSLGHVSPLLATALWEALGRPPYVKLIPALLGLAWLAWFLRGQDRPWDWARLMPPLLLVSSLTTVYGAWPFDLVLLYPALLCCAAPLSGLPPRRWLPALAYHLAVQAAALVQILSGSSYFWFLWLAPALALGYWLFAPPRPGAGAGPAAPHGIYPPGLAR